MSKFGVVLEVAAVNENWRVKIEYRFFGIDGDFLGVPADDDPTVDSFSIGVDYRFGRRARNHSNATTARSLAAHSTSQGTPL
jgi:hypothetical protein